MNVEFLTVGPLESNGFVLWDGEECVLIDPGDEASTFKEFLLTHHLAPSAILITHGHVDHIGAVGDLRKEFPACKVYCHSLDAPMLTDPLKNLAGLMGQNLNVGEPDELLEDGQVLQFGGIRLEVRHVPGHTPGHVVFLHEEEGVFAGDTLFAGGIGRSDFPGGNAETLLSSIRDKLLNLPDFTPVHPGHGPSTTIGQERHSNPFLQEGDYFSGADFFG